MRATSLLCALLLALPPLSAHGAKVYRCPDGSYADKPCGEGARVRVAGLRGYLRV